MAIKYVALIGANGNLGEPILQALVATKSFTITVLKRASSKSPMTTADPSIRVASVDNQLSHASLVEALRGQDALIVSFPLKDVNQHLRLCTAAAEAGVKRVIPADYGSCDSSSRQAQELVPLFYKKVQVRELLQELAAKNETFTWTSLVGGHFFDWGLRENFLHFDMKKHYAEIFDDGELRSSLSTLGRVAEAVVKVLQNPDPFRNRMIFMQSFCISQLDLLASVEAATGKKWQVKYVGSKEFIKENKAKADAGDSEAVENLVFALGAIDGDWEKKEGFAMKELGLEDENLDEVVTRVVKEDL